MVPKCTLGDNYLDVALVAGQTQRSGTQKLKILLGLMERKKIISESECLKMVGQVVCYMVSALAFSRLGIWRNKDPLVALLVASNVVYRIQLKRSRAEFGWAMQVQRTTNTRTMEWLVSEYVDSFISDHRKLVTSRMVRTSLVHPLDWIPLNVPRSKWKRFSNVHNLGFLFNTTSTELLRFRENSDIIIEPPRRVIVKLLSPMLDRKCTDSYQAIRSLLSGIATARAIANASAENAGKERAIAIANALASGNITA